MHPCYYHLRELRARGGIAHPGNNTFALAVGYSGRWQQPADGCAFLRGLRPISSHHDAGHRHISEIFVQYFVKTPIN